MSWPTTNECFYFNFRLIYNWSITIGAGLIRKHSVGSFVFLIWNGRKDLQVDDCFYEGGKKKTKRLETKLEQFSGVTGYFVPRIKLTVVINTSSFVFFDRNIWIRHSCWRESASMVARSQLISFACLVRLQWDYYLIALFPMSFLAKYIYFKCLDA